MLKFRDVLPFEMLFFCNPYVGKEELREMPHLKMCFL